jgi:1,4-dihydroxy-6-naphthoate synthase
VLRDIQTLNEWAREGQLEFTALSVHNLAYVADRYVVLNQGGSFGDGYGPMLVARDPIPLEQLRDYTIAVPSYLTSAYLALRLFLPDAQTVEMPFDAIMPAVQRGEVPVGLLIHEGQLTHREAGLRLLLDLGVWWGEQTGGLPLPLGVNAVRRDLPEAVQREIARAFRESIRLGLENRDQAMRYAMQFGRGIDPDTADRFVGMYVNALTLEMGERGRRAIHRVPAPRRRGGNHTARHRAVFGVIRSLRGRLEIAVARVGLRAHAKIFQPPQQHLLREICPPMVGRVQHAQELRAGLDDEKRHRRRVIEVGGRDFAAAVVGGVMHGNHIAVERRVVFASGVVPSVVEDHRARCRLRVAAEAEQRVDRLIREFAVVAEQARHATAQTLERGSGQQRHPVGVMQPNANLQRAGVAQTNRYRRGSLHCEVNPCAPRRRLLDELLQPAIERRAVDFGHLDACRLIEKHLFGRVLRVVALLGLVRR